MRPLRAAGVLAGLLACTASGAGESQGQPPLPTVALQVGATAVTAEVADDPSEREMGLMFRESLETDSGMLFVYPTERPRSFWMKNTPLPLTIAYLSASGRVVSMRDMTPHSTKPVLSRHGAMYALEMEQGWFAAHGVKVGDKVAGLPGPSEQ